MPASTQSNPAYKKRRIGAMLEESVFREWSHLAENSALTWSPKFISALVGLACLCAVSMFMVLYHHDAPAASAPARVAVTAAPTKAELPARQDLAANRAVSVPEPVQFKLQRSPTYQTVGPVGLRLLRVNLKRRVCDISIQLEGHRRLQKRLQLNRPFQFKPTPSGGDTEITVSGIASDSVAGTLAMLSASV